jgi:hypothetical protein
MSFKASILPLSPGMTVQCRFLDASRATLGALSDPLTESTLDAVSSEYHATLDLPEGTELVEFFDGNGNFLGSEPAIGITTILDRLGAFTGSGVNNVLGFFKALFKKDAAVPNDIGGTFNPATDSTEALSEAVAALPASMVVTLESAGVMQSLVTVKDGEPLETVQSNVKQTDFVFGAAWAKPGSKVFFTAKADVNTDDTEAIINRECTITDAATMTGYITPTALEAAVNGNYYAEFNRYDADGVSNRVTIWQGKWDVTPKVRQ